MSLRCLLERLNRCLAHGFGHQDWNPASSLTDLPRRSGRRRRKIERSRRSQSVHGIEQLEARALLTTNLALFQNVVADSVHQDNAAEEAIDGIVSLESRWASADTAGPHWLEVQLQAPYPVGSAQVYLGDGWTNNVADFDIQYHDGDQWQTAAGVTGDNSIDHNLVFTNTIDSATRYRIYTEADRLQVKEFVLLPPNGGNAHPPGTAVNLNLASRYSTEVTSALGTNYPGNAVDGYVSDDSRWIPSDSNGTHEIELRFQQRQGVGSLHLYTGDANGSNHLANFNVEFFHTSGEYRAIPSGSTVSSGSITDGTVTGVTSGEVVINFGWPVSADRIRVSSADTNVSIREAVVLPPNNNVGYPIGTSVQFASPPTTQFTEFGDAWYQLVSRQNSQALVADETGATQAAAPVGEVHKYQLLYSYTLDAYRIRSKESGLALQVKDASQAAGAAIVEGEYSAAPHQLWKLEPTDNGHVQVVNVWSGMVLHTDGSDPSVVTQQPFDAAANPANNVEWQVDFVEDYFKKGTASRVNGKYGGSWWYNWGRGDFPEAPDDQFFAPMQWGPWNLGTLHQRHDDWNSELKPSYFLGFNEPDSANQSNMTIERAIEIWPQLQAMGVPLLSPAATQNGEGRTWHTEFTDQADALGFRQDYAGMHWYGAPNVNNILNYVDTISNIAHGRDVWITEFSPVDWSGGSGNWSEETNYNFILEFVYRADRKENLDKYSMFMWAGDQPTTPWEKSNPRADTFITDVGGELTPYGKAYAGWDGTSDPELETLYIIHNRAATHRLQNDGSNDVGKASIRFDDTSVQWIVQDAGNDEVFITSPVDGRRLKLDGGNIVMSDPGATGWGVRWKIEQDQYGWQSLVHSGSGNHLRMNRSNDASGAPTAISLDVVSPATAGTGANWWFVKPYQELGLTLDSSSIAEDGTATATLSTTLVTGVDTVVTLSVDDGSVVGVPVSVTIPAGQPSVTFTVTAVDDGLVDGTQSAFITADAANFQHAIAAIEVTDNDAAELALAIAADQMGENGRSSQATISRNTSTADELVVTLSSSDTSEATVPASVTIPAGANSVTFDVVSQDDAIEDGTVTVTVTAQATDHAMATDTIDILDDEGLTLTLTVDAASISESGQATATVQREGDTSAELIVSLASDDTDEATVPASVTILPGQTSATFTVSGVDDGILDVPATVVITAAATNFEAGSADVVVKDALDHRMSELTVIVQDQHGNPLPDATLDVSMTRHGFTFGTQVRHRLFGITQPEFDALTDAQKTGLLAGGSDVVPTWADVTNYRTAVYTHFNHIVPTNGMQWIAYNNAGPAQVDTAINLAQAEGFTVTGHAAVWGKDGWPTPNEYRSAANPNAQDFLDALIADRLSSTGVLARYSDAGDGPTITDWDVLNEPLHEHYYANTFVNAGLYANSTAFYADVFRRAHAVRPDARLAVNDYNIITSNGDAAAEQFRDFVNAVNAELAGEDASIEVIKVQAHTWLTLSKADITRRLDILAETGLPIVISEFDMRDDGGQLNAAQQEQTFRAFLEASFEHPNVEAFTMWGFWDAGHWRGNGPLYNQDWSFKAEAAPWTDLVEGDWQSEFLNQPVDTNARWKNDRALFDGLYTITANDGSNSATVENVELSADRQLTITINVADPALTLVIATDSVSEADGTAATTATVTRNTDTTEELVVNLSSSDITEATVPESVTIPADANSVTFDISAQDDVIVDGLQSPTILATATGYSDASDTLDVTDNDTPELTFTINAAVLQEADTAIATLTRNTDTTSPLIVNVSSSDDTEASVPTTVTIPAGQASTTFTVTAVDDGVFDIAATVTITTQVTGFDNQTNQITVEDALNHRLSNLTIIVQDQNGNPLPNATLDLSLTQHGFKFGTQVRDTLFGLTDQSEFDALSETQKQNLLPNLDTQFGIPRYTPTWTDVENYRNFTLANFNHVVPTTGLQWVAINNNGTTVPDSALAVAAANGLTTTGASVVWQRDRWPTPSEFRSAANPDATAFRDALIADRLSANGVLGTFSDTGSSPTITDWKLLNEPLHETYYADTFVDAGLYASETAALADYFQRAASVRPDATFSINEYNVINAPNDDFAIEYRDLISSLLAAGAPIDRIGIQAHISRNDITKADITRRLDILAETGLPIEISEYDTRDDANQLTPAEQEQSFRDFLEASFEHPAVDGFIMWGIWDAGHWRGNSPLYDNNWNLKTEASPWTDLVQGDWKSEYLNQPVDASATWSNDLALFDGTYTVTATDGLATKTIENVEVSGEQQITITLGQPILTLAIDKESVSEADGTDAATLTITRNSVTTDDLQVTITASDNTSVGLPASVVIPASQTSVTVDLDTIDDQIVDGLQTVTVSVTADGHASATDSIDVTDNDVPELTLTLDASSISETGQTTATVSRNTSTDTDLIVTLTLDDPSSAMVPSSVTILAEQDSASFQIQAIDDILALGNKVVTIQAAADSHTFADDTLTISDDDTPALTVSVSVSSISESDGDEAATGMVTRNTSITDALTVTLQSSNPNEAAVSQTVTIEAGQSNATFAIDAVDDLVVDGTQTVTILALADEHATATSELDVTDNDVDIMPGDVDGNDRFDANDSFLIQLIKLAGSNQQIDQSKGSSPLTANQIRSKVDALSESNDVDGDEDFDANDAFLVHLVRLAGTNAQIDQSKGNSLLTAIEIRSRIDNLSNGGSQASFAPAGIRTANLFTKNQDQPAAGTILPEADHKPTDIVLSQYRSWIDVL